jgi:hypothetical protein
MRTLIPSRESKAILVVLLADRPTRTCISLIGRDHHLEVELDEELAEGQGLLGQHGLEGLPLRTLNVHLQQEH